MVSILVVAKEIKDQVVLNVRQNNASKLCWMFGRITQANEQCIQFVMAQVSLEISVQNWSSFALRNYILRIEKQQPEVAKQQLAVDRDQPQLVPSIWNSSLQLKKWVVLAPLFSRNWATNRHRDTSGHCPTKLGLQLFFLRLLAQSTNINIRRICTTFEWVSVQVRKNLTVSASLQSTQPVPLHWVTKCNKLKC